jgi:hypothetical protein
MLKFNIALLNWLMIIQGVNKVAVTTLIMLTLSFSLVSFPIPSYYFVDVAATEDTGDDNDMHNQGHEDESEHNDDMPSHANEEGIVRIEEHLAEHSMVMFKAEKQSAQVIVHVEQGDITDGSHNVTIACESPESSLTFGEKLNVTSGHGEFEGRMTLRPATYSVCTIFVAKLSVMIPSFTIVANTQVGHSHGSEEGAESKVHVEHGGIVIFEGMIMHQGFEAGMYNVMVACKVPEGLSIVFNDAFTIDEHGEGKLKIETSMGPGRYSGCTASIAESEDVMVIATFDSFTIEQEEEHRPDGRTIEEKRLEKRRSILERIELGQMHKRDINAAKAVSIGDYEPGTVYAMIAGGTAGQQDIIVEAHLDISTWKSNSATILMDVTGGAVVIDGDDSYTVRIGYAIYAIQHDMLRLKALATNDSTGEIVQLRMHGNSLEEATFPMVHGDSIEVHFEGNGGRSLNQIGDLELFLEGTIEA